MKKAERQGEGIWGSVRGAEGMGWFGDQGDYWPNDQGVKFRSHEESTGGEGKKKGPYV